MVALFILKLMSGIVLMWLLMPRRDVTDGFFRIQMLVLLGLSVLLALTLEPSTLTGGEGNASVEEGRALAGILEVLKGLSLATAFVSYLGHIFWKLGRRLPGRLTIFLSGGLCLSMLAMHSIRMIRSVPLWLQLCSEFSSAAVLGATLTAMLLGHWYLTTPTMSIQPLTWFTKALMVSGVARLLSSAAAFAMEGWTAQGTTYGLWLTVRLIGGILVPLATAFFVARILSYRNTQSATGVLFAALILVFMGEMTATLLERSLHIPY